MLQTSEAGGGFAAPVGSSAGAGTAPRAVRLHHPNAIVRVAGLPFTAAERLATGRTHALLRELDALRARSEEVVGRACALLETAIGSAEFAQAERRTLLALKRSLFNRRLERAPSAELLARLSPETNASVAAAAEAIAAIALIEASLEATFGAESDDASARLRALCLEDENFLRGLAFSAPVVASDLFEARESPEKYTGKRGRRLDLGLLNYLVRGATKVSPLSYFTPVLTSRFVDGAGQVALGDRDVVSSVEFSRYALSRLLDVLTRDLSFWGDSHPLVVNPTAADDGTLISFTDVWAQGVGTERSWGIHPPLVRVPKSPRIGALLALYRSRGGAPSFTLLELYQQLSGVVSGDPGVFARFVAQALRAGLLLPELPFYEQEDGPGTVLALLEARAPQAGAALRTVLDEIARFAATPSAGRIARTKAIADGFGALFAGLGVERVEEAKAPLFYEDCFLSGPPADVPTAALGAGLDDLHALSALFPLLDNNHVIQSVIAGLFVRRYGPDAVVGAVECLDAIGDEAAALATRLIMVPAEEQEAEIGALSEDARVVVRQKRLFLEALTARMQAADDVAIDDAFLDEFAREIPAAVRARPSSYTVIGQADDRDGARRFVVNRLYSGHSMLMSRFLRRLDEVGLRAVRRYLATLAGGKKRVELPGVFGFNANVHPQLADAELTLPGRRPGYRATEKIDLASLSLRYDRALDRLAVLGPDGSDQTIHYFGFLSIMALPNYFQMLGRMQSQGLIPDLWQKLYFEGTLVLGKEPIRLARVTYGDVVLSRRSALLPTAVLPANGLSPLAFYRELYALMQRLELSGDHYVRLVTERDDFSFGGGDGERRQAVTQNAFKPTLLSFDIPLSVHSLQRRLEQRTRAVLLQESLPGVGEGGIEWRGRQHACELQFEISQLAEGAV